MEKSNAGNGSSPLASPAAVALWLVLGIVSTAAERRLLAGVFIFLFLLCGAALLWGRRAMKGVSLEGRCGKCRLFPGDTTEIRYTIHNDKLLPLIWLELSQYAPERDCLVPDDSFERYEMLDETRETQSCVRAAYRRSFAFVMGYETLTLSSSWSARRRGIYKPEGLLLRSGDGFGLTRLESRVGAERLPELVVYPRPAAVDVSAFLRSHREQPSAAMGLVEDISVLRGLRPYQTTDSWKRINWRMAARQPGELNVNFYETVQPVMALFALDGESFCAAEEEDCAGLEEALEILASVIRELFVRGISCGLCLPVSRRFPAVSLRPGEGRSAGELLYYLAGYDCLAQLQRDREGNQTGGLQPSRFDLPAVAAAASGAGLVTLITREPDKLPPELLRALGDRLRIYSAGTLAARDPSLELLPLGQLRKGAAACR